MKPSSCKRVRGCRPTVLIGENSKSWKEAAKAPHAGQYCSQVPLLARSHETKSQSGPCRTWKIPRSLCAIQARHVAERTRDSLMRHVRPAGFGPQGCKLERPKKSRPRISRRSFQEANFRAASHVTCGPLAERSKWSPHTSYNCLALEKCPREGTWLSVPILQVSSRFCNYRCNVKHQATVVPDVTSNCAATTYLALL